MSETTGVLPAEEAEAASPVASVFAVGLDFLMPFLAPHVRFVESPEGADFIPPMNRWEPPRRVPAEADTVARRAAAARLVDDRRPELLRGIPPAGNGRRLRLHVGRS